MKKMEFSPEQTAELARLADLSDDEIDTRDIPEAPAENWATARRGAFQRSPQQPVTMQLDSDILTWFKQHAPGGLYQSEINRVLRRHVLEAEQGQV